MSRSRALHDPFWDLDGNGVKRERRRDRILGRTALAAAIVAVGLTALAWVRQIGILMGAHLG